MARDCTCDNFVKGEPFAAGQCRLCFLYHNDERYKDFFDQDDRPAFVMPPPPPPPREPVGDLLAESFSWLGQVKGGGCCCSKLQGQMNQGVEWCRANYAIILDKLEQAAFARNLPIPRALFVIPLELALVRASFHTKPPVESLD